jgi:hypothetical protein
LPLIEEKGNCFVLNLKTVYEYCQSAASEKQRNVAKELTKIMLRKKKKWNASEEMMIVLQSKFSQTLHQLYHKLMIVK